MRSRSRVIGVIHRHPHLGFGRPGGQLAEVQTADGKAAAAGAVIWGANWLYRRGVLTRYSAPNLLISMLKICARVLTQDMRGIASLLS